MEAPNFMHSPLVVWVQTFSAEQLTYQELYDGIFLNEVMQQIDPRSSLDGLSVRVDDMKDRLQNWELLLKNVNSYYQDVLQQLIVRQPPDIVAICNQPESDSCRTELQQVLLLILGCAVQSDNKEQFVENIKQLDVDTQHAIVEAIQQITDSSQSIFPMDVTVDQMDDLTLNLYNHLLTLLHQRDCYVKALKDLQCTMIDEADDADDIVPSPMRSSPNGLLVDGSPLSVIREITPDKKCHIGVELAQCKAKMRRLRHELEDKSDTCEELQEELEAVKQTEERLRLENRELLQEARAAKCYRDELDILKDKASRVDKYESEITRLKERLNEFEFYRARVEELRADNSALLDTNHQLTEQLALYHRRIETVVDLENDLQSYKQQLAAFSEERERDQIQIAKLMRENARLEYDIKLVSSEESGLIHRTDISSLEGQSLSLMDQLSETTNSQILRLELENQRLRRQLEESNENAVLENALKKLELEKENDRLSQKVEKLLAEVFEYERKSGEQEKMVADTVRAQKNLEETMETVRETGQRQIRELEKEKEQLTHTIETIRERNEKTNDCRIADLERENKKLSEGAKLCETQLTRLEDENHQLVKGCERLTATVERMQQVEELNEKYVQETEELKKSVLLMRTSCEQLESKECELTKTQVENTRLAKTVELLQQSVAKKDELETENINLTVEVQQLKRNVASLKETSSKVADLELEKEELRSLVRKATEDSSAKKSILDQLQVELSGRDAQNRHLNDKVKSLMRDIETLQHEREELETEKREIESKLEETRLLEKRLDAAGNQHAELELENKQLLRDRSGMEKENRKLKQSVTDKDHEIDELLSKVFELENNNKTLVKSVDRAKEYENRMRELEKENLDLNQRMSVDKKTLATLRQDLVSEKIKTQQLTDEVDQAKRHLQAEVVKAATAQVSHTDIEYQELERKMEETFQKRCFELQSQTELLRQRLDDSRTENMKLSSELESYKTSRDRPLYVTQRYSHAGSSTVTAANGTAVDEVRNLRDQLMSAEKQVSKLQDELSNLKQRNAALHDQLSRSQTEFLAVQSQFSATQAQYGEMQSKLASLQVENATLHSQNSSLNSQNASLQSELSRQEERHDAIGGDVVELTGRLDSMEKDHDALQQLHEHLAHEHETLLSEHSALKLELKSTKTKAREITEQNSALNREMEMVTQMRAAFERDKASESQCYTSLKTEYIQIREENLHLANANDKLRTEFRDAQADLRVAKSRLQELKVAKEDLETQLRDCHSEIRCMEMELSRLTARCGTLSESNAKLEDDNRTLMANLQRMMSQNQELLTQLLSIKDQRAEEHRLYSERLADVLCQKEILEERMQQYSRCDDLNRTKSFTSNFVKKAKQIITTRSFREHDRTPTASHGESSYTVDSPENSSRGSSSLTKSSENLYNESDQCLARNLDWSAKADRRRSAIESGMCTAPRGRVSADQPVSSPSYPKVVEKLIVVHSVQQTPSKANNDNNNDSEEAITLDQFLQECDKSPKSRRKLLVEKRVMLDDGPVGDRKSDRLLATLPPRSPTIQPDADYLEMSRARLFKSEMNVSKSKTSSSSSVEDANRTSKLENGNGWSTLPAQQIPTRLATSISVGNNLAARSDRRTAAQYAAHQQDKQSQSPAAGSFQTPPRSSHSTQDPLGLWKVHDVNEARAGSQAPHGKDATIPQWCTSAYEFNAPRRVDRSQRHSSAQPQRSTNSSYQTTPSIGRQESCPNPRSTIGAYNALDAQRPSNGPIPERVERRSREAQNRSSRPRSVPASLLNKPPQLVKVTRNHESNVGGGDGVVQQYEPGNVRHLVQNYQSAFRPVNAGHTTTMPNHEQPTVMVHPHISTESQQNSGAVTAGESSCRRTSAVDFSADRRLALPPQNSHVPPVRADVNVCIVRPATGRTLPQPPPPPPADQSQASNSIGRPLTPRNASGTVRISELSRLTATQQDLKNSEKVVKDWQEYGCL